MLPGKSHQDLHQGLHQGVYHHKQAFHLVTQEACCQLCQEDFVVS